MPDKTIEIGRIVHYVARGSADGVYPVVCRAAIIAAMVDADPAGPVASLVVFNPQGLYFNDCPYDPEEQAGGSFHFWSDCKHGGSHASGE